MVASLSIWSPLIHIKRKSNCLSVNRHNIPVARKTLATFLIYKTVSPFVVTLVCGPNALVYARNIAKYIPSTMESVERPLVIEFVQL